MALDFDADIIECLVTHHHIRHAISQVEVGTVPVPPSVDVFDITDGEPFAVTTTIFSMACIGYRGPATIGVVGVAYGVIDVSDEGDTFARNRHVGFYASACIEVFLLEARQLTGQIARRAVGNLHHIIDFVLGNRGLNLVGSGYDAYQIRRANLRVHVVAVVEASLTAGQAHGVHGRDVVVGALLYAVLEQGGADVAPAPEATDVGALAAHAVDGAGEDAVLEGGA